MEKLANYLHDFFYYDDRSDNIHALYLLSFLGAIAAITLAIVLPIQGMWSMLIYLEYLHVSCLAINILVVGMYYRYYNGKSELKETMPSFIVSMSIFGFLGANAGITLVFISLIIYKVLAKLFTIGPMITKTLKNLNVNK